MQFKNNQKFWFPAVFDPERNPIFPFGIPYIQEGWRALIFEIVSDFPSEFDDKYIVPVATSRENMITFFANWIEVLRKRFIPKMAPGWTVNAWKLDNKKKFDTDRRLMERNIQQLFSMEIYWLYDCESHYDYVSELGLYMTTSAKVTAGVELFNFTYNLVDKIRGFI